MSGILFDAIVFGPVRSRRLGVSLGINLLPTRFKYCSFNCIYCECGWTNFDKAKDAVFHKREDIYHSLEQRLIELSNRQFVPDAITFAGNGEPTLHPEFSGIIDDTIALRDKYIPKASVTVLSNATMLHIPEVFNALNKIDKNILKLDTGFDGTFQLINRPKGSIAIEEIVGHLKRFNGKLIVQTMFVSGEYNGKIVDNTTDEEVEKWLGYIRQINPQYVMIYPVDRATPVRTLNKIPLDKLNDIAAYVEAKGIKTKVYY